MTAWTREQTAKRIAKGYGQGAGSTYKPWLGIRDVPSVGLRTRQVSRTSRRMHVTLSGLERAVLLIAQRLPYLVDVREQYPLPLADTDAVCARLGIRPPMQRGGPVVVTTDLLLHFQGPRGDWREAVAVKPSRLLQRRRVLQLLSIERVYWSDQGVRWRMVSEQQLPQALVDNLKWIDVHHHITAGTLLSGVGVEEVEADLYARIVGGGKPLEDLGAETDAALGQREGTALLVFRHLLSRKRWSIPMHEAIDTGAELDAATLVVHPAAVGDWA